MDGREVSNAWKSYMLRQIEKELVKKGLTIQISHSFSLREVLS